MKYCMKCGREIGDEMVFCPYCGAEQVSPAREDRAAQEPRSAREQPAPLFDIPTRSVGLAILFSFITFGIYSIYWYFQLVKDWNLISEEQGQKPGTSPGMVILLTIITFGIYGIYYWYKMSKQVARLYDRNGNHLPDNTVICVLLAIFDLDFIAMAIHQSEMNSYLQYGV